MFWCVVSHYIFIRVVPKLGYLPKQGLYSPDFEKKACGVGFVAKVNGEKSFQVGKLPFFWADLRELFHLSGEETPRKWTFSSRGFAARFLARGHAVRRLCSNVSLLAGELLPGASFGFCTLFTRNNLTQDVLQWCSKKYTNRTKLEETIYSCVLWPK